MEDEIERIRSRWASATPGPWIWTDVFNDIPNNGKHANDGSRGVTGLLRNADGFDEDTYIVTVAESVCRDCLNSAAGITNSACQQHDMGGLLFKSKHDMAAIAAAPDDIAILLREIDSLQARLRQ